MLCKGLIQANGGLQEEMHRAAQRQGMSTAVQSKLRAENQHLREDLSYFESSMEQQQDVITVLRSQLEEMETHHREKETSVSKDLKKHLGDKYAMKMLSGVWKKSRHREEILAQKHLDHLMKALGNSV